VTIENLKAGLDILVAAGYKGYGLAAEHDVLYVLWDDKIKMPLSTYRTLKKLGFHVSSGDEHWYIYT